MFRFDPELKVYLHREAIDFLVVQNGLVVLVEQVLGMNQFEQALRIGLVCRLHAPAIPALSGSTRSVLGEFATRAWPSQRPFMQCSKEMSPRACSREERAQIVL